VHQGRGSLRVAAIFLSCLLAAGGAWALGPSEPARVEGGAGDARSHVAAAEAFRFSEDWYPAIDEYLAAVAKNPSYGVAYEGLAECYYELGEYDQALSYVRKAAPFLKGDTGLANLEGFVRIGLGDLAGARKAFSSVADFLPNDLDARFGLSLLDLSAGRKTAAKERLEESLRLSPQNGRALLSLALIASDQGRKEEAQVLVERALRYHGSEPRTQYVAASLAAAAGDLDGAVFHARSALDLKPGYSDARLLLGGLMYSSASYDQAIALMREAVAQDRKDGMAWYTLGMAQRGAGKKADAIYSLKTACSLRPDDEIARIALELVVADSTSSEDASRKAYADWHLSRGKEFEDRSSYDQAIFEYRRALRIYPYSADARLLYAGMLKARGFPGKYLSELEFLEANGQAKQPILDEIETYKALLIDAVGKAWKVDEEALPKRPYKIALMCLGGSSDAGRDAGRDAPSLAIGHVAGRDLVLRYLQDILASSSRAQVIGSAREVSSFAEAFKTAREEEADYFALIAVKETERDVELDVDLRVARTGSPASAFKAYRSGNDRLKNSVARVAELLVSSLPPLGSLVKRSQDKVLVDLGKADGLEKGAKLLVVKKLSVKAKPEGLGLTYPQSAVLAEVTVTGVGEEASEGTLKSAGFFDTVNIGDQVFIAPAETAAGASASGPASGPASGQAAGQVKGNASTGIPAAAAPGAVAPAAEPQKEWPGLFSAIRALR
jgi:tetratricopeptide (TPR) repeat protein